MIKKKWMLTIGLSITIILSGWLVLSMYQRFVRYDPNGCNCADMSEEIRDFCDVIHVPCSIVHGCHKNSTGDIYEAHAWVRILGVDWESTWLAPCFLVHDPVPWVVRDVR